CDGIVGRSGVKAPWARSLARLGSLPSSIQRCVSLASTPSKPRMISLFGGCCAVSGAAAASMRRARDRARIFKVISSGFPRERVLDFASAVFYQTIALDAPGATWPFVSAYDLRDSAIHNPPSRRPCLGGAGARGRRRAGAGLAARMAARRAAEPLVFRPPLP